MRFLVLLTVPVAVLLGLERPAVPVALLLLTVLVAAVARTGLWLLDDLVDGDPDAHALRAGGGAFVAGTTVAAGAVLLGPSTVVLVVPATLLAAWLLRSGRPSWLRGAPEGPVSGERKRCPQS